MAYRPYGVPPRGPMVPPGWTPPGYHPGYPHPGAYAPFPARGALHPMPTLAEPPVKRPRVDNANVAPKFTQYGPDVSSQGRRSLEDFVENFAKDPNTTVHSFDASLTSAERKIIHKSCLKWKLFSKSRGTGDSRCLVISKSEISLDENITTADTISFDPLHDHINVPLKAWLEDNTQMTLVLENISQPDLRYIYQLSTTFGFHPASQDDDKVVCTKLSAEDKSKQFSYKTLFTKEMVDVKSLSSVLDDVQKPTAAQCAFSLSPTQAALLGRTVADPDIMSIMAEASQLGVPWTEAKESRPTVIPNANAKYTIDENLVAKLKEFRDNLPITKVKDDIVKALQSRQLLVLSGQTGSGKTTQVPQFVLDGGLLTPDTPIVLCTQPRRIAAMSVAERIAQERGQAVGQEVGYQVRFGGASCNDTRLLFVTPGILFRRMQSDPNLTGVGAVIVDEVHERDVYTDFALLVIKRMLLEQRCHFKVVLMSATLQAEGFASYFAEAIAGGRSAIPYINVEGRLFPVKDYYLEDALKWTGFELNQLQDAVRKEGKEVMDCNSILNADLTEMQAATTNSAREGVLQVLPKLIKALKKPYELQEVMIVTPLTVTKGEKYSVSARFALPADLSDWRELELEIYRTELGQTNLTKVKTIASSSQPAVPQAPTPAEPPTTPTTATSVATHTPSDTIPEGSQASTSGIPDSQPSIASSNGAAGDASPPSTVASSEPTESQSSSTVTNTSSLENSSFAIPNPPATSTSGEKVTALPLMDQAAAPGSAGYVVPKPHCALIAALIYFFHAGKQDGGILVFLPGMNDIKDVEWELRQKDKVRELWILRLHSGLPPSEQKKVFEVSPVQGLRKVVLSTNMAESSVTIEDIVFVIDSGLMKEKHYNPNSNVASLDCQFVSQVNVVQRRGRAGRVRAGVAVHLFPRSHYTKLTEFPVPELCRSPLEDVCLMIKSIGVGSVADFIQTAMDPPEASSVTNAVHLLQSIKALAQTPNNDITALGYLLSTLPVDPLMGRLLLYAALLGVLRPVATIVGALTQRNPFNIPFDDSTRKKLQAAKEELRVSSIPSDHILLLRAVNAWEAAPNRVHYAETHCMSNAALNAIRSTRDQLLPLLGRATGLDRSFTDRHADNLRLVAACMAMGLYPNVAWKAPESFSHEPAEKAKRALTTPDGHRAGVGRDSVNFDGVPEDQDFFFYFERVSYRGTLVLQDTTINGPLPLLLASNNLTLSHGGGGAAKLKADDVLEVTCTMGVASLLTKLHSALQGALHLMASGASRRIPHQLLQSLAMIVSEATARPVVSPTPATFAAAGPYATGAGPYATGAGPYATGTGPYATGTGPYATGAGQHATAAGPYAAPAGPYVARGPLAPRSPTLSAPTHTLPAAQVGNRVPVTGGPYQRPPAPSLAAAVSAANLAARARDTNPYAAQPQAPFGQAYRPPFSPRSPSGAPTMPTYHTPPPQFPPYHPYR